MGEPLVSIITITYNRADLIYRCIESIQNQTYRNYEHIIVDGCSCDNTSEVVNSYHDDHIKYVKLEAKGPDVQMAAGYNVATGKYVTFLDDDDEYLPEKLEKQVAKFEGLSEEYGMVYCWMTYYNTNNPKKTMNIHNPKYRGDLRVISAVENKISGTPTLMVRHGIIEKVGGIYNDNKVGLLGSDVDFATRVCQVCLVDYLPESLIKVYVNHGHARLTTNFYSEYALKNIKFHKYYLENYNPIFEEDPKRANYHLFYITRFYYLMGDRKNGNLYFRKLVKTGLQFVQIIKVLSALLLRR